MFGLVGSIGMASLIAYCSASNIMQVDGVEMLDVIKNVGLTLVSTISGMYLNASLEEIGKRRDLANDYAVLASGLRRNDGEAIARFLESKYPGVYAYIENQMRMKYEMQSGGKTL